jgi:hypothetical protein
VWRGCVANRPLGSATSPFRLRATSLDVPTGVVHTLNDGGGVCSLYGECTSDEGETS